MGCPDVQRSMQRLFDNLSAVRIPLSVLEQYMPEQSTRVREGLLGTDPRALCGDWVRRYLDDYSFACGQL